MSEHVPEYEEELYRLLGGEAPVGEREPFVPTNIDATHLTLVDWLRAQLDEDEQWARAASAPYPHAVGDATVPPAGVHWRWVAGDYWETVVPDPVVDEFVVAAGHACHLATVEQWPSPSGGSMPRTYDDQIVEMDSAAAGHIARHDPARVLREVEAKRRRLDRHRPIADPLDEDGNLAADVCVHCAERWPCPDVLDDAAIYADRAGYRAEWRST